MPNHIETRQMSVECSNPVVVEVRVGEWVEINLAVA